MSIRGRRRGRNPDANKLILTTGVPIDDQFSTSLNVVWSSALGKLIVATYFSGGSLHVRNANLGFLSKYFISTYVSQGVACDSSYIFAGIPGINKNVRKLDLNFNVVANSSAYNFGDPQALDARDANYLYQTTTDATLGHGIRMYKKSDMSLVFSVLATGAGDEQFSTPTASYYYSGELFVSDSGNNRITVWAKTGETLVYNRKYDLGFSPRSLCFDGTNWYVQSATNIYKYDNAFTDATKASSARVGHSVDIIPDQGDGNGATLAIANNTSRCLYRCKCSDLSLIATVGSAGDGSSSLCDPVITGPAGTWTDSEGGRYAVASGANISKNGFSGNFFRGTPNRLTYQPTGATLAAITALDANADAIVGEIKNLHKCINLTSLKLQTNPALVLDLGRLSAKMQTLWAYACGSGIFGSIRHMTALSSVNLRENGASSAQVDGWIDDLWQNRDIMAPGSANLNGTNSAPNGIYQDATPPTTGKEKAFDLVENYGWSLAITT